MGQNSFKLNGNAVPLLNHCCALWQCWADSPLQLTHFLVFNYGWATFAALSFSLSRGGEVKPKLVKAWRGPRKPGKAGKKLTQHSYTGLLELRAPKTSHILCVHAHTEPHTHTGGVTVNTFLFLWSEGIWPVWWYYIKCECCMCKCVVLSLHLRLCVTFFEINSRNPDILSCPSLSPLRHLWKKWEQVLYRANI